MAKRIYVGGLPYSATDAELESLFAAVGAVISAQVVTDRYTGQARGFGFVEMSDDAQADTAINKLNGSSMGGRTLTVNEARPREDRRSTSGSGSGGDRGGSSDRGYGGSRW